MADNVNLVVVLDKHAYRKIDEGIQAYAWISLYDRKGGKLHEISSLLVDIVTPPFETHPHNLLPEDPDAYYSNLCMLKSLFYQVKYSSYLEDGTVDAAEIIKLPTWENNDPLIFDMLHERATTYNEYVPKVNWNSLYGTAPTPFEEDVAISASKVFKDPVKYVMDIITE